MNEGFLSRWARLKRNPDGSQAEPKGAGGPDDADSGTRADRLSPGKPWSGHDPSLAPVDLKEQAHEVQTPAEQAVPELPAIDTLVPSSDFRPFMQAGVPAGSRNAALKKLFADPAFNVMDGLDTYIDDYSLPSPIPADMLKGLMENHMLETAQAMILDSPPADGGPGGADTISVPPASLAAAPGPRIAAAPGTPATVAIAGEAGATSLAGDAMASVQATPDTTTDAPTFVEQPRAPPDKPPA